MAVAVVVLLPFLPALVGGEVFVTRDHLDHFVGKRFLLAQALHGEGSLIWNPFRAAGTPFLADPQSGVLYPPALAVFGLLGPGRAFGLATTLYLALHGLLGGLGTWGWLRARRLAAGPAALGAIAWSSCGLTLSFLDLQNNWCTLAWCPIALLAVERCLRTRGLRWPAWLALALGLACLAGEPQVAGAIALLSGGRLVLARRGRRSPARSVGRLALVAALAAALTAVQLVPLLVHVRHTLRADGVPLSLLAEGSLRPIELLDLFAPGLFQASGGAQAKLSGTQPWITTLYLGWVSLALASWLTRRRLRALAPWLGLAAAGLLLGMGPHLPGGSWLLQAAGLDLFRYPVRFVFLLLPALSLLTAHGAARLAGLVRRGRVGPRRALTAAAAALALGLGVAVLQPETLGDLAAETAIAFLRGAALAGLVGAVALALQRGAKGRRGVLLAFAFLLALDLLSHPLGLFDSVAWNRLREPHLAAPLAALAHREGPPARAHAPAGTQRRMVRLDDAASPEARAAQAFARLAPGAMELLGVQVLGRDGVFPLRDYEVLLAGMRRGHPALDEFLALDLRLTPEGLVPRAGGEILRAVRARPGGESWPTVVEALGRPGTLETRGVPVPTELARTAPGSCADEAVVRLESWRAHDLRARVEAPCPVVVLHLTSAAPGWSAEIDGLPARIEPALGAFQAVGVPAGRHDLRLVHRPPGLQSAAAVSAAALLLLLLLVGRRPAEEGSGTGRSDAERGSRARRHR